MKRKKHRREFSTFEIRLIIMQLLLLGLAGAIVFRLLYVQVWERSKYQRMAEKQYFIELPLEARRGLIYDRNMNYLVLNEPCVSIGLDRQQMQGTSAAYARKLAPLLGVSAQWLQQRLRSVKGNFVWLRRRLDIEVGAKIDALNLPGIRIEKDMRRIYPHHEVGSHIIGFTNSDNQGIAGIELQYDKILSGRNGRLVIQRDGRGRAVPENVVEKIEPKNGESIVLAIDYILQTIATDELRKALLQYDAVSGSVIICDPNTGEILAMANEPHYNPNAPGDAPPDSRRNRAITDAFEPGSTFKIVTFAAALEAKMKKTSDLIFCENGVLQLNDRVIRDTRPHGWLSMADVLAYSSNIGTAKIAGEVGAARLYTMARKFGFGEQSHVDFPGENAGILRPPSKWTSFTIPSIAIGQEVSGNALQLAMAYAAIANGGRLLKPTFLRALRTDDGQLVPRPAEEAGQRVISRETAGTITHLLQAVVEKGTGMSASIPGLQIAGKTGTAQKTLPGDRGYSDKDFVSSFVGYFPAAAPRFLVLVVLHTDRENQWGSKAAAPTFKQIAEKMRIYDKQLHTQGGRPDSTMLAETVATELPEIVMPNFVDRRLEVAEQTLAALGFKYATIGEGEFISDQSPRPGTHARAGGTVKFSLYDATTADGVMEMPSVIGLSLREALNKLTIANLDPVVYGHGRVIRQKPAPGVKIKVGIRCIIEGEGAAALIPELSGSEN